MRTADRRESADRLQEARRVLEVEARAVAALAERLDSAFLRAVDLIADCRGRVVTTGMGKSGIIARKLAATFSSTGTPSLFLHPAEAVHGDLGNVVAGDVVVALSHSGETEEIARLLETLTRLAVPLVALTGGHDSTLARYATEVIDVGVSAEACPLGLAPTASTTAALAMGDALAMSVLRRKGFQPEDFAAVHPAGRLGARLRRVHELMHPLERTPRVSPDASMADVIPAMTAGRLGLALALEADGRLAGILTDGDLRRLLQGRLPSDTPVDLRRVKAADCMSRTPRTIGPDALAAEALRRMEEHSITSLVVGDDAGRPLGVIHLHDLWRTGLI